MSKQIKLLDQVKHKYQELKSTTDLKESKELDE